MFIYIFITIISDTKQCKKQNNVKYEEKKSPFPMSVRPNNNKGISLFQVKISLGNKVFTTITWVIYQQLNQY